MKAAVGTGGPPDRRDWMAVARNRRHAGTEGCARSVSHIGKALGTKDCKKYIEPDEFHGLPLADVSVEMREAILVGAAALPHKGN